MCGGRKLGYATDYIPIGGAFQSALPGYWRFFKCIAMKKVVLTLWVVIAVGLPLVMLVFPYAEKCGELDQQRGWSVLQGMEFANRRASCAHARVLPNARCTEFGVAGLPPQEGFVWMVLNPASEPSIKRIPSGGDMRISRAQLARIKEQAPLDEEEHRYLETLALL